MSKAQAGNAGRLPIAFGEGNISHSVSLVEMRKEAYEPIQIGDRDRAGLDAGWAANSL
jgi:hypothetical protein